MNDIVIYTSLPDNKSSKCITCKRMNCIYNEGRYHWRSFLKGMHTVFDIYRQKYLFHFIGFVSVIDNWSNLFDKDLAIKNLPKYFNDSLLLIDWRWHRSNTYKTVVRWNTVCRLRKNIDLAGQSILSLLNYFPLVIWHCLKTAAFATFRKLCKAFLWKMEVDEWFFEVYFSPGLTGHVYFAAVSRTATLTIDQHPHPT